MTEGPLQHVRILDLTHVWAGPLAVRMLSDLGAEVVKVEGPLGRGPRQFPALPIGGWMGGDPADEPWNRNAAYVKLARNRRSVCMDLKEPEGRTTFLELVAAADVVIENFSARAMPALDLGYEVLAEANPRIIYVTMPGFGTSGPYRDRVAFGPIVEAMSGLTNVLGYGPGEPRNTAMALMDPVAATAATNAVLSALRRREATGTGTRVEMSLHEAGVALCGPFLIDHQLGATLEPVGNRHPLIAPHGVYRAAGDDEWLALACVDDPAWKRLCDCIDGLDPSLALAERQARHDEIDERITAFTCVRTKDDAMQILQAAGIPAGAVNTTPDMTADPQVVHREFFVPLEIDNTPVPGNPVKLPGTSSASWTPSPRLGADNHAVLGEWLGKDEASIRHLEERQVLFDGPPV